MANHKLLIPFVQKWEGGFSNDPDDKGGSTMYGVTIETYSTYRRKKGYSAPTVERLKQITQKEWEDIFKTMYWDKWQADLIINQSIANILVDWIWCSGAWGIKIPQRLLGLKEDGVVGPITLKAINNPTNYNTLFNLLKDGRHAFVDDIAYKNATQQKFLKGWKNRINDLKFI